MQDVRYRMQVEDPVFKREWMNGMGGTVISGQRSVVGGPICRMIERVDVPVE